MNRPLAGATLAAVAAGSFTIVALLSQSSVAAQAPVRCLAVIDGVDAQRYDDRRHPVTVDHDARLDIRATSATPVSEVRFRVELPFVSPVLQTLRFAPPEQRWAGTLDVADIGPLGTGLQHIEIDSGDCTLHVWLRVDDGAPLTSPLGATGVVLLVGGLIGLVVTVVGRLRGSYRLGRSVLAGASAGLGALLITQQVGTVPLTTEWLTSWIVVPGLGGAVLHTGASVLTPGRHPAGGGDGAARGRVAARSGSRGTAPPPPPFPDDEQEEEEQQQQQQQQQQPASDPMTDAMREAAREPAPEPTPIEAFDPVGVDSGVGSSLDMDGAAPDDTDATAIAQPDGLPTPVGAEAMRGPTITASGAPPNDPPRTSYARLECPHSVVVDRAFVVTVGLAPEPVAGVVGPALVRPPTSVGSYFVTVQLVADGFRLVGDDAWRFDLPVTVAAPHPSLEVHLVAEAVPDLVTARSIQAIYSIAGQTIGFGVRPVAVLASEIATNAATAAETDRAVAAIHDIAVETAPISVPTGVVPPDLTVRIVHGVEEAAGRLLWTFETPWSGIALPDRPVATDIGDRPEVFAKRIVQGIAAREGQPGLAEYLRGIGLTVGDHVPNELFELVAAIGARMPGRAPSVFLLSEEPYVPWELMVLDPPLDPSAPPFLSAQVDLGRWVLGQRRPVLPPPRSVRMRSMVVVSGIYDTGRLLEAEEEAAELSRRYRAASVEALAEDIIGCLATDPPADVVHFAVHGRYDADALKEGLVLLDGTLLDPLQVKGAIVHGAPLVFLNACQVGSGNRLLGDYSGVAQAFLYAGAAAVVAPLWSVDDRLAKQLALDFYTRALDGRLSPAQVLRETRAASDPDTSTHLAYQYFGHPSLALTRA